MYGVLRLVANYDLELQLESYVVFYAGLSLCTAYVFNVYKLSSAVKSRCCEPLGVAKNIRCVPKLVPLETN